MPSASNFQYHDPRKTYVDLSSVRVIASMRESEHISGSGDFGLEGVDPRRLGLSVVPALDTLLFP